MRALSLTWVGVLIPMMGLAAEIPAPTGDSIVAPDARLELLFSRTADISGGLTESPAVAPDGSIYFSDIPRGADAGMIQRFDPKTGTVSVFTDDSHKSNGLVFSADGTLYACEGASYGGRGIGRWNVETGEHTVVVNQYQGNRFNSPNDICIDRQGRLYFSDPRYVGHEPRELEHRAVYRLDRDGTVREITHMPSKPNGVGLSPDGRTLYVAETDNNTDSIDPTQPPPPQGDMKLYAFPLDDKGLVSGKPRTLVDFGDVKGCDGMTLDDQGRIYLSVRSIRRPGVMVITPEGQEVAFIPTGPPNQSEDDPSNPPVGLPSNVEFGIGDDIHTLYVTIDLSLHRIRLKSSGYHAQYAR